ncbi:MAG: glycosyltransferase, partial [Lachnospiraceae bacterium]
MRIAMMTNNYKPFVAGVPISIERLTEGLRKLGHEVVVFAPTYKEQQEEIDTVRYHSLLQGICGGVSIPSPIDKRIEAEFKKREFDIIHVHHPMIIGKTAVYLSRKYNIPMTFTYHTRYEQYAHYVMPEWMLSYPKIVRTTEKLIAGYLKEFFKHCDHIFVPTEGMAAYLEQDYSYPKEQLSILPTGISDESFLADADNAGRIRRQYGAEECPLFISVSRMAKEKNISFLLESLQRFKESYGKPFKMLLVGDGPDKIELEKTCAKIGLSEEVNFIGKIDNCRLKDYYKAADAFLFASKSET